MTPVRLQPVGDDECRLLWEWANDSSVRASAFRTHPIAWEEHAAWWQAKRSDPDCHMLLIMNDRNEPVGQIRFDVRRDGVASTDISVSPSHRRQNVAAAALPLACRWLFEHTNTQRIVAAIRLDNVASQRLFAGAGFTLVGCELIQGVNAQVVQMERSGMMAQRLTERHA